MALTPEQRLEKRSPKARAIFQKAVHQINTHPESHRQGKWRCQTGMCFAGWVAELSGETMWVDRIEDLEPNQDAPFLWALPPRDSTEQPSYYHVDEWVTKFLGLSVAEAETLFQPGNEASYFSEALQAYLNGENLIRARYPTESWRYDGEDDED